MHIRTGLQSSLHLHAGGNQVTHLQWDVEEISRHQIHLRQREQCWQAENRGQQPDGILKVLSPRQVANLLGHVTSGITELYYVKKDTARLAGITTGFEL